MTMRRNLLLFALLALTSTCAHSQFAAGVAFTSQHITIDQYPGPTAQHNTSWTYGPSFSFQGESGHVVKVGFDVRLSLLNGGGFSVNSLTIGPRLGVRTPIIGKLYGEFLLGAMGVRQPGGTTHTGHIDNAYVVGLDHTIAPRVDWRVVEYAYSRIFSLGGYANEDYRHQFSTGVLFRF